MAFPALAHGALRPHVGARASHASLGLRLRVRVHRLDLTRRLAEGADVCASRELALRAGRLTSPREVRACVEGLDRVLRESVAPSRGLTSQAPLQREAIRAARPFLLNLRERLRETESPRAAGVARVELLLTDGAGPLYAPSHPGTLASLACRAADAI
jgi:hypothetical protein